MSLPAKYNIPTHYRADTWLGIKFQFFDDANTPVDLSGVSNIRMQVKQDYNLPAVIEWNSTDGDISISSNEVTVNETPGNKMAVPGYNYKYDIQFLYTDGKVQTYVMGFFPIYEDVTRPTT